MPPRHEKQRQWHRPSSQRSPRSLRGRPKYLCAPARGVACLTQGRIRCPPCRCGISRLLGTPQASPSIDILRLVSRGGGIKRTASNTRRRGSRDGRREALLTPRLTTPAVARSSPACIDLTRKRAGRLGTPRRSSVASRGADCTGARLNPRQNRTEQARAWILTRPRAIHAARCDGAASGGPEAPRPLPSQIWRYGSNPRLKRRPSGASREAKLPLDGRLLPPPPSRCTTEIYAPSPPDTYCRR